MEHILKTNNLEKRYKKNIVLNNLNMNIEKNSIYGLIGKNGAGKTTLIRIITGLQNPTKGNYSIYGVSYQDKEIKNIRTRISAIVETPTIYMNLTAKENLIEHYKTIGLPSYDNIDELLSLVGLSNTQNKKVKYFSLGMKQRLAIAISLASNPDFLILDEPINGLDPEGIIEIRELILNLNKHKGITILISSHYLDELSKIATHYGFIDKGTIIKEISKLELDKQLRKKTIIKVNNIKELSKYLENKKINYQVIDNQTIAIFDKIDISQLVLNLSKKKCTIEEIYKVNESLENYYLNLIGGGNDD